ncbi:MAG TPA: hypothetical protein DDZ68_03630 [Parvularcula sp.]|nr:hypothetical protein [Parvularcula sp.]HBS32187.1 hypothetical protein [Parvularcula sp.]HBS33872.1 hypothetical protein [Parvularcula sp.]
MIDPRDFFRRRRHLRDGFAEDFGDGRGTANAPDFGDVADKLAAITEQLSEVSRLLSALSERAQNADEEPVGR